ncbi:hypothetical protein B2J89_10480 [Acidovorax sp. SRB_24]|nr:hypothetical protein [Acidovorax sp. SRB_24]
MRFGVWCAVRYLLKSNCQRRMLPGEFPKWRTVLLHFATWSAPVTYWSRPKSGWRGSDQTGAQRLHDAHANGASRCKAACHCGDDGQRGGPQRSAAGDE